jgi:signal transduction histidine kinase
MESLARRMLVTADAERRRLERTLHDGAQQRLVAVSTTLALARRRLEAGDEGALELVELASEEAKLCIEDLRDLARTIYPAVLSERGLASALRDLARRSPVPVEVQEAPDDRLPEPVAITACRVVSEALESLTEEAGASQASVRVTLENGQLMLEVRHDGRARADLEAGSRLGAVADRVGALGGRLELSSPSGGGTLVRATIPAEPPADGAED